MIRLLLKLHITLLLRNFQLERLLKFAFLLLLFVCLNFSLQRNAEIYATQNNVELTILLYYVIIEFLAKFLFTDSYVSITKYLGSLPIRKASVLIFCVLMAICDVTQWVIYFVFMPILCLLFPAANSIILCLAVALLSIGNTIFVFALKWNNSIMYRIGVFSGYMCYSVCTYLIFLFSEQMESWVMIFYISALVCVSFTVMYVIAVRTTRYTMRHSESQWISKFRSSFRVARTRQGRIALAMIAFMVFVTLYNTANSSLDYWAKATWLAAVISSPSILLLSIGLRNELPFIAGLLTKPRAIQCVIQEKTNTIIQITILIVGIVCLSEYSILLILSASIYALGVVFTSCLVCFLDILNNIRKGNVIEKQVSGYSPFSVNALIAIALYAAVNYLASPVISIAITSLLGCMGICLCRFVISKITNILYNNRYDLSE